MCQAALRHRSIRLRAANDRDPSIGVADQPGDIGSDEFGPLPGPTADDDEVVSLRCERARKLVAVAVANCTRVRGTRGPAGGGRGGGAPPRVPVVRSGQRATGPWGELRWSTNSATSWPRFSPATWSSRV